MPTLTESTDTPEGFLIAATKMLDLAGRDEPLPQGCADALRRRAVSTAYYGLFHAACRAISDRLTAGLETEEAGNLPVRAFRTLEHSRFKAVARRLSKEATPADSDTEMQLLQEFCLMAVELQALRHRADYDPGFSLSHHDAMTTVWDAYGLWFFKADSVLPKSVRFVAELLSKDVKLEP